MSSEELQRKTSINIQEKANLIWSIADKLVGVYKPGRCKDLEKHRIS